VPSSRHEGEVAQVSGQAELDEVGLAAEVGECLARRAVDRITVGIRSEARPEALLERRCAIDRASAVHGVTQAVAEGADAGPAELTLDRLAEQGVVGHLAEVPALSVEVHRRAVDAVFLRGEGIEGGPHCEHGLRRVVAHEVEPETVNVVLPGEERDRVHHQLLRELVLGRHVLAAGGGFHRAAGIQTVVVAGHDPVEHGCLGLAARGGVVEDLVEYDLEAVSVQRSDHAAELLDASPAVGIHRVRSLRHQEVEGVVAPVEPVGVGDLADAGLLLCGCRGEGGQVAVGLLLGGAVLLDCRDVEGRQQVHRVEAGLGEGPEVPGAVAVDREGVVGAAQLRRNGLV